VNELLARLPAHQSSRIAEMVARDPGIVDLTMGLPAYGPPDIVRAELALTLAGQGAAAARHDRYAPVRGAPALLAAIAGLYGRQGVHVDPDAEVVVTHGAAGAMFLAVLTGSDAGDEILLPDPCYMLYEPVVGVLGRVPVRVPTYPADGFALDPERVEAAVTSRTRMLIINSPANPTGVVCPADLLSRFADLARRRGLRIVYDEVLENFSYAHRHAHLHALAPDVGITVNSLSKRFGMAGWRIGWLIAAPGFAAEAAKAHTFGNLAVNHVVQLACASALADPDLDARVGRQVRQVRHQGEAFVAGLAEIPGIDVRFPDGGFYAFADVRDLAGRLPGGAAGADRPAGDLVAEALLERARVAVVAGSAFGTTSRDHVRLSFPGRPERLDEALGRIAALAAGTSNQIPRRA
jgi:aspartate/methionine/tyrosine aminotransferase